jgi:hypothetical protein
MQPLQIWVDVRSSFLWAHQLYSVISSRCNGPGTPCCSQQTLPVLPGVRLYNPDVELAVTYLYFQGSPLRMTYCSCTEEPQLAALVRSAPSSKPTPGSHQLEPLNGTPGFERGPSASAHNLSPIRQKGAHIQASLPPAQQHNHNVRVTSLVSGGHF